MNKPGAEGTHTPGPWEYDTYNTILAKLEGPGVEDGRAVICSIPDHPSDGTYTPEESKERGWWYSQSEQNAYLIAAAPDMLEALKAVRAFWPEPVEKYVYSVRQLLPKLDAAIRKAEGSD